MRRLMEHSGETANLAILDGTEAVFIAQVQCHEMMRILVRLGSRVPLHASGVGKAIFASLPDEQIDAILKVRGLAAYHAAHDRRSRRRCGRRSRSSAIAAIRSTTRSTRRARAAWPRPSTTSMRSRWARSRSRARPRGCRTSGFGSWDPRRRAYRGGAHAQGGRPLAASVLILRSCAARAVPCGIHT